jgi:hypothetical protein
VSATVSIEVAGTNRQPTADSQSVQTDEDLAAAMTLTGDDGDDGVEQALSFAIVDAPQHGTLTGFNPATGQVTYTPDPNYNGPDSFTFTVTDDDTAGGHARTSDPATVTLTVLPINDAPTASAQSVATPEDTATLITLSADDGDAGVDQSLVFAIVAGPQHGTLTGFNPATGQVTYTPDPNYNGPDSFTFTVTDDASAGGPGLTSTAATVSIDIAPVNDPPAAAAQSVSTEEGLSVNITLAGSDGDDGVEQALTFAIVDAPQHGTLSGFNPATGQVLYTPDADYHGPDSFTFTVTDDGTAGGPALTSAAATVSISVDQSNARPIAHAQSVSTAEDVPLAIALTGEDGDDDVEQALTFAIVIGPKHGQLSGFNPLTGQVTYTPGAGFNGSDDFTFIVTDDDTAGGDPQISTPALVVIEVAPQNDPPLGDAQSVATDEDEPVSITLTGSDGDPEAGQALTFAILDGPSHGTLSGFDPATGEVLYTPDENFNGSDSFTFVVTDDDTAGGEPLDSQPVSVSIQVDPVNDSPVALAQSVTLDEDTSIMVQLTGDDSDPELAQTLTFTLVSGPSHAAIMGFNPANGKLSYLPLEGFNGVDTITFTVTDDDTAGGDPLTSPEATLTLTIIPVNDTPSADGQALETDEDEPLAIQLTGTDGDGELEQTLTFAVVDPPQHGTLSGLDPATGEVLYTPDPDYHGPDSFTFTVTDDDSAGGDPLTSPAATIQIEVLSVNDPVTAGDDTASVEEDSQENEIDWQANDSTAPDGGEVLSIVAFTEAAHGDVSTDGERLFYTPEVDFVGVDTFTYTVEDGHGGSATATVSVQVLDRHDEVIITGADTGGGPHVRVFSPETLEEVFSFFAYHPNFTGGVRVASADVNGDGTPDYITAAGPGGGPHVRVIDGVTHQNLAGPIGSFFAYHPNFTGGVYVAAGDVNGDGLADVITAAGAGGGPHVRVFSGADGSELSSFFAYNPGFTGGVRVAAGDLDGDGLAEIITGAGTGGGPHVRAFDGQTGLLADHPAANFFAYFPLFLGGVYVAAGDLDGDGLAEIITGAGSGGGPHVRAFSGEDGAELFGFFAYDPGFTGGVVVSTGDVDFDGQADIITAPGPGGEPEVRLFSGLDAGQLDDLVAYHPDFRGGVLVAATAPGPVGPPPEETESGDLLASLDQLLGQSDVASDLDSSDLDIDLLEPDSPDALDELFADWN